VPLLDAVQVEIESLYFGTEAACQIGGVQLAPNGE